MPTVLKENDRMLALAQQLGFEPGPPDPSGETLAVHLRLQPTAA